MSLHHARRFLMAYIQPSLTTVQAYLMIFIVVSLLSFATFLRDFSTIPILFLQMLSPIIVPIFLYIVPIAIVSASIIGFYARASITDAISRRIHTRLKQINIALPLVLSLVYLLIFLQEFRGDLTLRNFGIYYAILSVPSALGGAALGDYATQVAYNVLHDAPKSKVKRPPKRLEDPSTTRQETYHEDDAAGSQWQQGRK